MLPVLTIGHEGERLEIPLQAPSMEVGLFKGCGDFGLLDAYDMSRVEPPLLEPFLEARDGCAIEGHYAMGYSLWCVMFAMVGFCIRGFDRVATRACRNLVPILVMVCGMVCRCRVRALRGECCIQVLG